MIVAEHFKALKLSVRQTKNTLFITRKAQRTQRGTRDIYACVKARCERNL